MNLALAAEAKCLVSRDRDLLDLMHDESFRRQYPDLQILEPVAFLRHGRTFGVTISDSRASEWNASVLRSSVRLVPFVAAYFQN